MKGFSPSCNARSAFRHNDNIDQTRTTPCSLFVANEARIMRSPTSEVALYETLGSTAYQSQLDRKKGTTTSASTSSPDMENLSEQYSFDLPSFGSRTARKDESATQTLLFSLVLPPTPTPAHLTPPDTGTTASFFSDSSSSPGISPTLPSPRLSFSTNCSGSTGVCWPRPSQINIPLPPAEPLPWIWQCHVCKSRYPLSVTRRCLIDGHLYCSGQASSPQKDSAKRRKKDGQGCTSEFDYAGWAEWGNWKRKVLALNTYAQAAMDRERRVRVRNPIIWGCEGCNFPSQCRYEWGKQEEEINIVQHLDQTNSYEAMSAAEADTRISVKSANAKEDRGPNVKDTSRTMIKKKSKNVLGLQIDLTLSGKGKKSSTPGCVSSNKVGEGLVTLSSPDRDVVSPWYQAMQGIGASGKGRETTLKTGLASQKPQGAQLTNTRPKSMQTQPLLTDFFKQQMRSPTSEPPPISSLREKTLWRWKRRQTLNGEGNFDNTALSPKKSGLDEKLFTETKGIHFVFGGTNSSSKK